MNYSSLTVGDFVGKHFENSYRSTNEDYLAWEKSAISENFGSGLLSPIDEDIVIKFSKLFNNSLYLFAREMLTQDDLKEYKVYWSLQWEDFMQSIRNMNMEAMNYEQDKELALEKFSSTCALKFLEIYKRGIK